MDADAALLVEEDAGGRGRRLFLDGDLRDEVSHLANSCLRLFFVGCIDFVPDFLSGRVHRFKLISRHGSALPKLGF